jgi:hypothetical protein
VSSPRICLILLAITLGLLGHVDEADGLTAPIGTPTPTPEVSVRRGSGPLPPDCTADETAAIVTGFLDAFNRGDASDVRRFFPEVVAFPDTTKPGFQWYSVTDERGHFVTYDPAALPAYFAERYEQGEHLRLLRLEVSASWHPGVDIVYRLDRQADDLSPHEVAGKGAIDCADRTIFVWSMAQHDLRDWPERPGDTPHPVLRPSCGGSRWQRS